MTRMLFIFLNVVVMTGCSKWQENPTELHRFCQEKEYREYYKQGVQPLLSAIESSSVEDLYIRNKDNKTYLEICIDTFDMNAPQINSLYKVLETSIQKDKNIINEPTSDGLHKSALHQIVNTYRSGGASGLDKVINLLLDSGSYYDQDLTKMILMVKDFSVIKRYSDLEGVGVNAQDKRGITMLYQAAIVHGRLDLMTALLSLGADPNIPSFNYFTPLMEAESLNEIKILIQNNANLEYENSDYETALIIFIRKLYWQSNMLKKDISHKDVRKRLDIINYLLDSGANTNIKSKDGAYPIHYAARICADDLIQKLMPNNWHKKTTVFNEQKNIDDHFYESGLLTAEEIYNLSCNKKGYKND